MKALSIILRPPEITSRNSPEMLSAKSIARLWPFLAIISIAGCARVPVSPVQVQSDIRRDERGQSESAPHPTDDSSAPDHLILAGFFVPEAEKQTSANMPLANRPDFSASSEFPSKTTETGLPFSADGPDLIQIPPFSMDEQNPPLVFSEKIEAQWSLIRSDHGDFYSPRSLTGMAAGFGLGAIMANTPIDGNLQRHFQSGIRHATSDEWYEALHTPKKLGNGVYTLPIFAAAWAVGEHWDDAPEAGMVGEWGHRSLRTFLVGAPPVLILQQLTGGSRPGESNTNSKWKPFQDNNGVSGHSFMGAVPFLTAAKMTEKPWLKFAFYAGSTLVPLSRINDNGHYPSQAFLGWWMAYLAASAIDHTETSQQNFHIYPKVTSDELGLLIERTY